VKRTENLKLIERRSDWKDTAFTIACWIAAHVFSIEL